MTPVRRPYTVVVVPKRVCIDSRTLSTTVCLFPDELLGAGGPSAAEGTRASMAVS